MNDMETMKKQIAKKIKLAIALFILSLIVGIIILYKHSAEDFLYGYQCGVDFGIMMASIIIFIKFSYIYRSEERIIQRYIEEHDERNLFLADKVGYSSFCLETFTLLFISVVIPMFISEGGLIIVGMIITLYIIIIIRILLYIYYKRKF